MWIFNIFRPIRRRFRRYLKLRMMPMSVDEAAEKQEFFAKLYFLTSLLTLIYVTLQAYEIKAKDPAVGRAVPIGEETADKFGMDGKVRILKFSGLKKVEDYYYERKEDEDNTGPDSELHVEDVPA